MTTRTAIVLFTRDLRVHDNPTLQAAADQADHVLPLFVFDDAIAGSTYLAPNRAAFLTDSLSDLDESLRGCGSDGLVVRRGDPADEVAALAREVGASSVHLSGDWSRHAQRRLERLRNAVDGSAVDVVVHDETLTVSPPGVVTPDKSDHFAVFTPYHRRWSDRPLRPVLGQGPRLVSPRVRRGRIPTADTLSPGDSLARHLPVGGETAGRRRMSAWLDSSVTDYEDRHDDLPGDATSRLSPYLHFGCVSPVELVANAGRSQGAQAFVRQLAWRDFHLQVLAARPDAAHTDYRDRGDRWRQDADDLRAWQEGRTGFPIIDAAMRQLREEGWMHNRARLLVGSFLTKTLYLDWREGARHFLHHLVDGEVSNNQLNWQWVAGTGTDSRPNRVLNPLTQADRHDPDGDYVRHYVPELADVEGGAVHRPWRLPDEVRSRLDYPEPIVDLAEGRRRFLEARDR
ncbi:MULTISPECIES: cryptochrome/photolyase family protein [unclassified Nocardioides]|uniref:cryptochrome/photolyase family protein n=1 Tax=unclassified Nocardioides TaxID=2615069 RepID=UPI0006F2CBC9|nr:MULTISPECIES: deoxyribodipyrimidine photo-lyase [unclassified Nocardioides]KQY56781.1 deoxyribodipyrimidine photolyase [Nocardioides sp. Root140]KQZ67023.1 deoxyribodipyrimidine photolyase [Nocardioides sp. Root151]KRF12901.1 deoxyribodipyrimidine photolyase [Nocardioides sp. Soil796]